MMDIFPFVYLEARIYKYLGRTKDALNPGGEGSSLVTTYGTPNEKSYH